MDEIRQICRQQPRELIEKWAFGAANGVYVGNDRVLCRVLRHFLMCVDARDVSVTPHLVMQGIWESWITRAIGRFIKPGMRCIDVGANMGYYTMLLASLVGAKGHVKAIEPNPTALQLLARTMSMNGLSHQVSQHQVAASEESGHGVLSVPRYLLGGATLLEVEDDDATHLGCACTPLDELSEVQSQDWDFIKIDVEGLEREVIHGLKQTLARLEHVAIAVEVTPYHWKEPPEGFLDALKLQGFKVQVVKDDGTLGELDYAKLPSEKGQWRMLWLQK